MSKNVNSTASFTRSPLTQADATAAPTLIRIGDREILLSPLSVGDMGVIERTAVDAAYASSERRVALLEKHGVASPENKKAILDELFELLDSRMVEARYLITHEGVALTTWLCARKNDPNITIEWIRDNLGYNDVASIQTKIDAMSFPEAPKTKKDKKTVDKDEAASDGKSPNEEAPTS